MLILLAEDDRVARLTMEKCLRLAGHEVVKVEDGRLALEILACNAHFQMLITELQMSLQSGGDLIRSIREREAATTLGPRLPIIAVSGAVTVTDVQGLTASGADRFLVKPVRRPALLREVDSLRRECDARLQARSCA